MSPFRLPGLAAAAIGIALAGPVPAWAGERDAVVYKSPTCGCCTGWVDHLREHGYTAKVIDTHDMDGVKKLLGVPEPMHSCHTARIGGYVIEGHVPAEAIDRLLAEKPAVAGLASSGMPLGSPGMSGPKEENVVHAFSPQGETVWGRY